MKKKTFLPTLIAVLALGGGLAIMLLLLSLRKPAAEASVERQEKPIRVEVLTAQPEDVPVVITGYGQARALRVVQIAPEVSGRVVEIHPELTVGGIIPAGEVLFRIDPRPYASKLQEAQAQVARCTNGLERLRVQQGNERQHVKTMEHAVSLSRNHYERAGQLKKEGIATQKEVEDAEQALVAAKNQHDQVAHALSLYPLQIKEMEQALVSAQARSEVARLEFDATQITAPFQARVKSVTLEAGQFVAAGICTLSLADDAVLELSVPLDSRNASKWLRFNGKDALSGTAWFDELEQVACRIQWTEDPAGHTWPGILDRVEAFDPASRTLTVAVRMEGAAHEAANATRFPLVDGMFCKVEIPGRILPSVYRLPQHTVSFENTVCVSINEHLTTVPVEVAYARDGYAYIAQGLNPGDQVIATRLVNPLENALLEIASPAEEPTS